MTRRRAVEIWLALLLGLTALDWGLHRGWRDAPGWELEMIARSLADGRGFGFPAEDRWLFAPESGDAVYPTAWREPLAPAFIAAAFATLGPDRGRELVAATQALLLVLTACAVAWLGARVFDLETGLLAGAALWMLPAVRANARGNLDNAVPAALLICLTALAVLRTAERPTLRRGLGLGALLGVGALVHAATLLFTPLAALHVVRSRGAAPAARRWQAAAALLLSAVLVLTPWTLRNWSVFGRLVPVRNGLGQNAYLGHPTLAETFLPDFRACEAGEGPPWRTQSAFASIVRSRAPKDRVALYDRQVVCMEASAPPGYGQMLEAERDALYARGALAFVAQHPGVAAGLWARRLVLFLFPEYDPWQAAVGALALVGVAISLHRRDARLPALLAAAYALPYLACSIFYYRYRYPIEPLLVLFASQGVLAGLRLSIRSLPPASLPRSASP